MSFVLPVPKMIRPLATVLELKSEAIDVMSLLVNDDKSSKEVKQSLINDCLSA